MENATINNETGLFESIKQNLHPSNLMKKFNINSNTLMQMAVYLAIGFLGGYLLKKYGKFVIVLILGVLGLLLFQQLGLISITCNPDKFQELFGITPVATTETNVLVAYWEWIKSNIALVLSFSIGFLIGLRVG